MIFKERFPNFIFLGVAVLIAGLLGPALLKKNYTEREIRMKALLRTFHSANEAYRMRHPAEGYAPHLEALIHNPEKIRYVGEDWLLGNLNGYDLTYQAQAGNSRNQYSLGALNHGWGGGLKSALCMDQSGILKAGALKNGGEPLIPGSSGCHGGIEAV